MDTIPQEKICTKCGLSKSLDEFAKKKGGKFGKQPHCRACKNAYGVTYTATNRDQLAAYNASRIDMPKNVPEEKACTKCQVVKPIEAFGGDKYTNDGYATRCRLCKRGEDAKFRKEKPEQVRQAVKNSRLKHHDERLAYEAKYREAHPDRSKERYAANKAFINAQNAARHAARQWERHNKTTEVIQGVNDLSTEQVLAMREAFDFCCQYCREPLGEGEYSVDHITAISVGGPNTLHNVVLACMRCNAKKHRDQAPCLVQPLLFTTALPRIPTKKGA